MQLEIKLFDKKRKLTMQIEALEKYFLVNNIFPKPIRIF